MDIVHGFCNDAWSCSVDKCHVHLPRAHHLKHEFVSAIVVLKMSGNVANKTRPYAWPETRNNTRHEQLFRNCQWTMRTWTERLFAHLLNILNNISVPPFRSPSIFNGNKIGDIYALCEISDKMNAHRVLFDRPIGRGLDWIDVRRSWKVFIFYN